MNFRPNSKFWNLFSDLFVDPNFAQSAYLDLALEVLESREMLSADILDCPCSKIPALPTTATQRHR